MPVADTTLYDILGVPPTASVSEIKKAYRKLALKHHPDKGGDVQKFQEMTAAHEVLSNEEKRLLYDRYGSEGLLSKAEQPGNDDIFAGLFGSVLGKAFAGLFQQPPRRRRWERRPAPRAFHFEVGLDEAFRGAEKKVAVTMDVGCTACQGSGISRPEDVRTCEQCQGSGVVIMETWTSLSCRACGGSGRIVPPEAVCQKCRGQGTCRRQQVYSFAVPPGAYDGQELPTTKEGGNGNDMFCLLSVAEHPRFQRLGDDLACTEHMPLAVALSGSPVELLHLDGRRLRVRHAVGEVVKPGSWWLVRGEGMPVVGQPSLRGDLRIHFDVDFPDRADPEVLRAVAAELEAGTRAEEGVSDQRQGFAGNGDVVGRDMEPLLDPRGRTSHRSRL